MRAVVYHPDAPGAGIAAIYEAEEADVLLNLAAAPAGSSARILDGSPFAATRPEDLPTLAAFDAAVAGA